MCECVCVRMGRSRKEDKRELGDTFTRMQPNDGWGCSKPFTDAEDRQENNFQVYIYIYIYVCVSVCAHVIV